MIAVLDEQVVVCAATGQIAEADGIGDQMLQVVAVAVAEVLLDLVPVRFHRRRRGRARFLPHLTRTGVEDAQPVAERSDHLDATAAVGRLDGEVHRDVEHLRRRSAHSPQHAAVQPERGELFDRRVAPRSPLDGFGQGEEDLLAAVSVEIGKADLSAASVAGNVDLQCQFSRRIPRGRRNDGRRVRRRPARNLDGAEAGRGERQQADAARRQAAVFGHKRSATVHLDRNARASEGQRQPGPCRPRLGT